MWATGENVRMKVFISADLEGITGTTDAQEMDPSGDGYTAARRWMASDVNAVIAGAFDAGATEVVVCDSHSQARNLVLDDLDPRASLIRGRLKPGRMVQGLDGSYDAAMLVGYHSRAGAGPGVLNHTWVGKELQDLRLNGVSAGEIHLVAAIAGHHGVPVVMVSGDDVAGAEARALMPDIVTVQVKQAIDRFAARLDHPTVTAGRLREGAAVALAAAPRIAPLVIKAPVTLEIEWSSTSIARMGALVPGVTCEPGARTTRFTGADMPAVLDVLIVLSALASSVGQQPPYS